MNRSNLFSSNLPIRAEQILPQRNFILLCGDGPRKEPLLAILRSMPGAGKISCFATLEESETQVKIPEAVVILLDYEPAENCFKQAIPLIRQWNHMALILLIVGHPREIFQDPLYRPDAVLWNDFSSANLMEEITRLL